MSTLRRVALCVAILLLAGVASVPAQVTGERRVQVIFVGWQGEPFPWDVPLDTQRAIDTIRATWEKGSSGLLRITGQGYGPYLVPKPVGAITPTLCSVAASQARAQAVTAGETWPNNSVFTKLYVNGFIVAGCNDSGGLGSGTWQAGRTGTAAHEFGHAALGVGHAGGIIYDPNDTPSARFMEYGSPYDPMGGWGGGVPNMWMRMSFGWTDRPGLPSTLIVSASGVYEIAAAELPASTRPFALRYAGNGTQYGIEYRSGAIEVYKNGLAEDVDWFTSGQPPGLLVGQTYQGTAGRLTATLLATTADTATLQITLDVDAAPHPAGVSAAEKVL